MSKHAKDILPSGLLPLLAVIGLPALFAAEPASLIHRTDREVAFEVTTNGLSRITFQGRVLATGEWSEKRGDETGCDLHSRSPIHAGRSADILVRLECRRVLGRTRMSALLPDSFNRTRRNTHARQEERRRLDRLGAVQQWTTCEQLGRFDIL